MWAQMFADIMQLPVETVEAQEAGALGCAIASAVAAGEYQTMDEAVKNMTVVGKTIEPNKELAKIYDRKYHIYIKTLACLDGLWDEMQELVEVME